MTDEDLREAAALALGWAPAGLGQWYAPVTEPKAVVLRHQAPPLDWITAGTLLEMCCSRHKQRQSAYLEANPFGIIARRDDIDEGGALCSAEEFTEGGVLYSATELTARNVIEACVMALREVQ